MVVNDGSANSTSLTSTVSIAAQNDAPVIPVVDQFDLKITLGGDGTGTVTSSPGAINCGSSCTTTFNDQTLVFLSETAGSKSVFSNWGGDCWSNLENFMLTIDSDKSCKAFFVPDTDEDSMPDSWELANGLDPNIDDAHLDYDNDGISNLDEFLGGTDPWVYNILPTNVTPSLLLLLK